MPTTVSMVLRDLREDGAKILNRFAQDLYHEIVRTTPKRTGRAMRNWTRPEHIKPNSYDAVVTSNQLPYIPPLENGSSRQAPHGFIQPSIEKITRKYEK